MPSRLSILEDMQQLVAACYPKTQEEALKLWHEIKPIKFGNTTAWTVANIYIVASYAIPDDEAYFAVMRTEAYITTNVVAAAGFGLKVPLPAAVAASDGRARWAAQTAAPADNPDNITGIDRLHLTCDAEEFLLFKGGVTAILLAGLAANPTADARFIVSTVYGYLLGPTIGNIIGAGEVSIATPGA